jgi:hypothetical protein
MFIFWLFFLHILIGYAYPERSLSFLWPFFFVRLKLRNSQQQKISKYKYCRLIKIDDYNLISEKQSIFENNVSV